MLPLFQHFTHHSPSALSLFPTKDLDFIAHIHMDCELIYIQSGSVEATVDGITYTLVPGDVCLIMPHQVHSFKTLTHSETMLLIFDTKMVPCLSSLPQTLIPMSPIIPIGDYTNEVLSLLQSLHTEMQTAQNHWVINGYLQVIMGRIHCATTYTEGKLTSSSTLQLVLEYMSLHYYEPISLDTVAYDLGLSRSYISHIFNTQIGFSFNYYRNTLRIDFAKKLLLSAKPSITQIAYQCGFESLRSFNRVFKDLVGVSPSHYKKIPSKKMSVYADCSV